VFVTAACLGVIYMVFAGQFSWHELLAGAVAWGLAMCFVTIVQHAGGRGFAFVFPARAMGKVAASLALDSGRVGAALWRAVWRRPPGAVGRLSRQGFRRGGKDPRDAGRRALIAAAKSLAPNEFVVDIPERGNCLYVHSLASEPSSEDLEWPI
jgi:multisubunit Na+/H+ antiporter MnhE subunit